MAEMGWTTRVTTAAGVAAGTGAAQLGLGYGLGVVVWPVTGTTDESVWLGSLGWATWITASATVFGAMIGSRLGGTPATRPRGPWRAALAASAGLGALVAVALIALPARAAVRADAHPPQVTAAAYALVGLLLGVVVAYWAVVSRPVAANLTATAAWLWGLAVAAIVVELTTDRTSATYLTSWQFAEAASGGRYGTIYWPSALLTVGAALVIGIVAAAPAARRGSLGLGAATSGAVGPLLVAASFLALAPKLTGDLGPIESAYLIAPYAVLAGLGGSALTVTVAQAMATRRARRAGRGPAAALEALPAADPEPAIAPTATAARATRAKNIPKQTETTHEAGEASSSRAASANDVAVVSSEITSDKTPSPKTGWRAKFSKKEKSPADADAAPVDESNHTNGQDDAPAASATAGAPAAPASAGPSHPGPSNSAGSNASATGPGPVGATGPANPGTPSPRPASASAAVPKPGASAKPAPAPVAPPKPAVSPARPGIGGVSGMSGGNAGPGMPGGPARPPQQARPEPAIGRSAPPPPPPADPEIAEAARPGRGRAKKAAPPRKAADPAKEPKSTVTPPPPSPTIAQINPKPPASG